MGGDALASMLINLVLSALRSGGSYKKIGYYDSSQKNLSWFGNDVWIGKPGFLKFGLIYADGSGSVWSSLKP